MNIDKEAAELLDKKLSDIRKARRADHISPKEFKQLYPFFMKLKERCSTDPVFFINTFCYTFNPKQPPYHLPFKLFDFQTQDLIPELRNAIDNGHDLFVEKCREMGATYVSVALFIWYWLFVEGTNILLGSRKEDYVDNRRGGTTGNKEESLFGKIDYILARLPGFLLPEGWNPQKHFTYMSLVNPKNGNIISGESSNANFSRGGRFKVVFLDEFAFWESDHSAWGSTADTTRCRIVVTTPGTGPSKAKRLRFGKDGEEIKVLTLDHTKDPRKTQEWLDYERKRRSSEDFDREIMINWEGSVVGRVYPELSQCIVSKDYQFMPGEPFYIAWDFGLDGTALTFWQMNPQNGKPRLLDFYQKTNQIIDFFFPFFGRPIESIYEYNDEDIRCVREISQYPKGIHFGDPDVKKRSYIKVGSTIKSLREKANIHIQCQQKNDFTERKNATKLYLQSGIEVREHYRTDNFLELVRGARYPQRDEASQATTPIVLPVHDHTSHARTSMEYFFVNIGQFSVKPESIPDWAKKVTNNFSPMKRWGINRRRFL